MLLLPIGRDDAVVQRHAWISYAILTLNIVVFIGVNVGDHSRMQRLESDWNVAMKYIARHPYLQIPDSLDSYVPPDLKRAASESRVPVPDSATVAEEQSHLDEMASQFADEVAATPIMRLGYVPAHPSYVKLFTSMFMHSGFMHLVGNMLFFFVTGPFIEDVFGRPIFAFLYFAGGVVATYSHVWKHASSTVPVVGASGAIAAVMGAYLIRFARSKLEFIWIPILLRPTWNVRFHVPAFVVLPLWFGEQLLMANVTQGDGGVAFEAHIGGFVFGMLVAFFVKGFSIEEKYVAPVIEKQTTFKADPRLERAFAAKSVGNLDGARKEILSLLHDDPKNVDALRVAVDLAVETEDVKMLDNVAPRLLAVYSDTQQNDAARELIDELWREHAVPRFIGRAAAFAEKSGDRVWAISLIERLCQLETLGPAAVGSLVKLGTLRRANGDMSGARDAFVKARSHPDCSMEVAPAIDAKLQQLGGVADRGW